MVRFALLSGWHVHTGWFAGELLKSGAGKFVAVWDEDESRGRKYAEEFGAEFEPNLSAVLAREDVDAVMVECPTTNTGTSLLQQQKLESISLRTSLWH